MFRLSKNPLQPANVLAREVLNSVAELSPVLSGTVEVIPASTRLTLDQIDGLLAALRRQTCPNWKLVVCPVDKADAESLVYRYCTERRIVIKPWRETSTPSFDPAMEGDSASGEEGIKNSPFGAAGGDPTSWLAFHMPSQILSPYFVEYILRCGAQNPSATQLRFCAQRIEIPARIRHAVKLHYPDHFLLAVKDSMLPHIARGSFLLDTECGVPAGFSNEAQAPVRWYLDSPKQTPYAQPIIEIRGWILGQESQPPDEIEIQVQGSPSRRLVPNELRLDVARALAAPRSSAQCGFRIMLPVFAQHGTVRVFGLWNGVSAYLGSAGFVISGHASSWIDRWMLMGMAAGARTVAPCNPETTEWLDRTVLKDCDAPPVPGSDTSSEGRTWSQTISRSTARYLLSIPKGLKLLEQPVALLKLKGQIENAALVFGINMGTGPDTTLSASMEEASISECLRILSEIAPFAHEGDAKGAVLIDVQLWQQLIPSEVQNWDEAFGLFVKLSQFLGRSHCVSSLLVYTSSGVETPNWIPPTWSKEKWSLALRKSIAGRWGMERAQNGATLMVTHNRSGGTLRHVDEMALQLEGSGRPVIAIRSVPGDKNKVELWMPLFGLEAFKETLEATDECFKSILERFNVKQVHVHHLLDFPCAFLDRLPEILGQCQIPYFITLHDYATFCPRITLLTRGDVYCGEPDQNACQRCVNENGSDFGFVDLASWRPRMKRILELAKERFAPSTDCVERFRRHFPELTFTCRPHWERPTCGLPLNRLPASTTETRRIGIIGGIGPHKGSKVICALAKDALQRALPLQFVIIGTADQDALNRLAGYANVTITGRYEEARVFEEITLARPDLAFFPAIWPETYSYTLSIAFLANVIPVAFDIGAIASRIQNAGWGHILDIGLSERIGELNDRLLSLTLDPVSSEIPMSSLHPDFEIEEYYSNKVLKSHLEGNNS